jgi:outer membrane protein assembly factor BamB
MMSGRTWYNIPGGMFRCVDLRTGEILWEKPGSINLAQHLRDDQRDPIRLTYETQGAGINPSLWGLGATEWKIYDPWWGNLLRTITNVPGGMGTVWYEGYNVVYCYRQGRWNNTIPYRRDYAELIKWDLSKVTGNDWMTGVVWNVSTVQPDGTGPGQGDRGSSLMAPLLGDTVIVTTTGEDTLYAFDATTGAQIWTKEIDHPMMGWYWIDEETFYSWDSARMELNLIEIETGNTRWTIPLAEEPWGSSFGAFYKVVGYGNIYVGGYDGYLNCIDIATGNVEWRFFAGETTETVFHSWAFYKGAAGADGKIYASTSEHTPTQPRIRGNKLYCLDAFTGDLIWNIAGGYGTLGIAEGYLVAGNENDGYQYCFAKGKTETTVEAPLMPVAAGERITIRGSVMDMSPAQPNTPAIADECMGPWMEYLHMQKPMPMATGVPVKLIVIHPDGNIEWIYTRTTDMYGHFAHAYEPPTEGIYQIIASFDGSESYWGSVGETAIGVGPGPSPSQQFSWHELAEAPITTEVAIITAVAVAVVIGVVSYWMLRKRQ